MQFLKEHIRVKKNSAIYKYVFEWF
jgi:hypothetical protein